MMFNFRNFDEVFDFDVNISYSDATVREIESNRKKLEGIFIDRVLKLLAVKRREFPV